MESTSAQVYIFLITLYGGMTAGLAYDIYRMIRRAAKNRRWVTALIDSLFVLTLGAVLTAVLYAANSGELRLYTFVGVVLGFALYMSGLSPFIAFLVRKLKKRLTRKKD